MRWKSRAGLTLAELLVAMVILAVIGTAAAGAIRMQVAAHARVTARVAAAAQLREAAAPLAADLHLASSTEGDLIDDALADTTLALHATVAYGHVCALAPGEDVELHALVLRSRGRPIVAGDTMRVHAAAGRWHAGPIAAVTRTASPVAGCAPGDDDEVITLDVTPELRDSVAAGAVLRVTRPLRYSFYRAGDGRVYLGLREWSHAAGALAGVQPVAGPFEPQGTRFSYFDSTGSELEAQPIAGRRVAAIGVSFATLAPRGWRDSMLIPLRNR